MSFIYEKGGTGQKWQLPCLVPPPGGDDMGIRNLEKRVAEMEGEPEPEPKAFKIPEAAFAESMGKIAATIPPDLEDKPSPEVEEVMELLKKGR